MTIPEGSSKHNLNLPHTGNYLHSIHTVSGITSNREMISSTWEDVLRLYATNIIILYEGLTTEDEMAGWHHRLDGREFE